MINSKLTEEQRTKWLAIVKNELMSSDEDDAVWRSEYVDKMFQKFDEYCFSNKSPQGKRQTKQRVTGSPSSCPTPACMEPIWAFKKSSRWP